MGKIVCVGSANVDIVATAKHLPVGGETVMGSALSFGPGGKGSNQVTAAHRAGAELVFVTKIGDDPLAATLTEHYKKDGISMKYVEVVPGAVTSTALIEVDGQTAQNSIVVVAPLLETISEADVARAEAEFAAADVVLVQYETSVESILAAKALAKKYHKTFVVNPAPFREMPEGFYDGVDLLTPNFLAAARTVVRFSIMYRASSLARCSRSSRITQHSHAVVLYLYGGTRADMTKGTDRTSLTDT